MFELGQKPNSDVFYSVGKLYFRKKVNESYILISFDLQTMQTE